MLKVVGKGLMNPLLLANIFHWPLLALSVVPRLRGEPGHSLNLLLEITPAGKLFLWVTPQGVGRLSSPQPSGSSPPHPPVPSNEWFCSSLFPDHVP